jgi:hypothetical protein
MERAASLLLYAKTLHPRVGAGAEMGKRKERVRDYLSLA